MTRKTSLIISKESSSIIKYLSIVFVILTHANGIGIFTKIPYLSDGNFTSSLCKSGLAAFLILSSYGLCCSVEKNGLDNFWHKRIVGVLIPAIIIQIVYYITISIINRSFSTYALFGNIMCLKPDNDIDGSMWFISMIFFLYFVFYILQMIFKNISITCIVMILMSIVLFPVFISTWYISAYCALCFPIGILYHIISKRFVAIPSVFAYLGIILGYSIFTYIFFISQIRTNILENLGATAFAIATILLFCSIILKRTLQIFECSYFLFLIEMKFTTQPKIYEQINEALKLPLFIILFIVSNFIAFYLSQLYNRIKKRL